MQGGECTATVACAGLSIPILNGWRDKWMTFRDKSRSQKGICGAITGRAIYEAIDLAEAQAYCDSNYLRCVSGLPHSYENIMLHVFKFVAL